MGLRRLVCVDVGVCVMLSLVNLVVNCVLGGSGTGRKGCVAVLRHI